MEFQLPNIIQELVQARINLRNHYNNAALNFTFDGKLVGDIGEAIACEYFGITLLGGSHHGIDGHTQNGESVQIKATGTNRGPAFRCTPLKARAHFLLFFSIDFDLGLAKVIYNGPQETLLDLLPYEWQGQRPFTMAKTIEINNIIAEELRLPLIGS